jgi:hypothetical protein
MPSLEDFGVTLFSAVEPLTLAGSEKLGKRLPLPAWLDVGFIDFDRYCPHENLDRNHQP